LASVSGAPPTRAERRASKRRSVRRRIALLALALAAGTAAAAWAATNHDDTKPPAIRAVRAAKPRHRAGPLKLAARSGGSLAAPLQDESASVVGRRVVLLGGLDSADVSTSDIRIFDGGRSRTIGHVGTVFHDGAAVAIGGAVYEFGGGDGVAQLDRIVKVEPGTGTASVVGRLPAPSSDHAAAVVDGTAYVVGGYTGARWLDTIVSWRPGTGARIVAHLPTPIRYAAVTAAAGKVVIAGGSLPSGAASRAVYAFDPATRAVRRIGNLPAPTTHAAAAPYRGQALVIGGRGAQTGTATARIVAVDPVRDKLRLAGRLTTPTSDAAAFTLDGRVLVAGGRGVATTAGVTTLVPGSARRVGAHLRVAALNVYAHDGKNALSPVVRGVPPRVYVPNSGSNTVDVVDQRTFKIVAHYAVGRLPQHVTPSYDLKTLWVDNDEGNSLTPLSPITGRPKGPPVHVTDPYNLYFTPNGRYAIVVAERNHRLDFRSAHSMKLHRSLSVPCRGVDHMDFSANGRYLLASCEFSGQMIYVDVLGERVVKILTLPHAMAMPQDVKLSPDGRVYYVADMASNGIWEIDARRIRVIGFIHTGAGAHGLYPSRDARLLYITNRGEGSISVLDFRTRKLVDKWNVGGSPDMGGVSADGKVLWLSGRYNAQLYAISTRDGHVIARIDVGNQPHGVCVWPQPGRYSLGHTGILR
jgi:DNA-binding beta-propeller fold protein YncE